MADRESLLLTDLCQLNMIRAHDENGLTDIAVFEFSVRKLPARRQTNRPTFLAIRRDSS